MASKPAVWATAEAAKARTAAEMVKRILTVFGIVVCLFWLLEVLEYTSMKINKLESLN